ncbi:hypothetical protein R6Z07M_014467 [Ovis aries]
MRAGEDPCGVLRTVIIMISHEHLQVFALDIAAGPQCGELSLRGDTGEAPEPGEIRALKQRLLRSNNRREQRGSAASCLKERRSKAPDVLAIDEFPGPHHPGPGGGWRPSGWRFTLLPEQELQMLLDVPSELVQDLGQSRVTVQQLQNATRDRREEARQSRRLLERSHRALEKDSGFLSKQQESRADLGTRGTLLTRALETAPPKLPLQARSSWR